MALRRTLAAQPAPRLQRRESSGSLHKPSLNKTHPCCSRCVEISWKNIWAAVWPHQQCLKIISRLAQLISHTQLTCRKNTFGLDHSLIMSLFASVSKTRLFFLHSHFTFILTHRTCGWIHAAHGAAALFPLCEHESDSSDKRRRFTAAKSLLDLQPHTEQGHVNKSFPPLQLWLKLDPRMLKAAGN